MVLTRKKGEKRREREENVARSRTIILAATFSPESRAKFKQRRWMSPI
jgi:hypothetical protein